MSDAARTWHHGLVARWWAEFNQGGDDLEGFRRWIEPSAGPVLDAGCGTGRLLLPWLRDGMDVDGADASPDMLAWCRTHGAAQGLAPRLYPQAMHELDLPRRYGTAIVCGAFGLGGTRAQDLEGLRRLHRHLLPGGRLIMDHHLPNLENPRGWRAWIEEPELPRPWPEQGDRRPASDGTELEISVRQFDLDPLDQTTALEIRVVCYRDDQQIASEIHRIHINLYFRKEIELMLAVAGFASVEVRAFGEDRPPRPWSDPRIVFVATA